MASGAETRGGDSARARGANAPHIDTGSIRVPKRQFKRVKMRLDEKRFPGGRGSLGLDRGVNSPLDNDGAGHLGGLDGTGDDTTADRNIAGEGALLVDVGT